MNRKPSSIIAWQRRSREAAFRRQKKKQRAMKTFEKKPTKARKKPIRSTSKKRAVEIRLYTKERREWLKLERNRVCHICLCVGRATPNPSTEIHHARGRIGRLLRDRRFWVASCRPCRSIPHDNPKWARSVGILAEQKDWNVYPSL